MKRVVASALLGLVMFTSLGCHASGEVDTPHHDSDASVEVH